MPDKAPDNTPHFSATITVHRPQAEQYSFDQLEVTVTCDDLEELFGAIIGVYAKADDMVIAADRTPLQPLPAPQPQPQLIPGGGFAMPQAAPQPFAAPQGAPGGIDIASLEAILSPCGDDAGTPLGMCTDKSLQYIATKYKKDPALKAAAGQLLMARRQGMTMQKSF